MQHIQFEEDFPWWALAMLQLGNTFTNKSGGRSGHVRKLIQDGMSNRVFNTKRMAKGNDLRIEAWESLKTLSYAFAEKRSLESWRNAAYSQRANRIRKEDGEDTQLLRQAALSCPRAFCQIVNITDEQGNVWDLEDFHVQIVHAMRRSEAAAIFIPLEHGKSATNSILVPLMDWAEWPDSTSCRVYWNKSNLLKWIKKLMGEVEYNDDLHKVFPWIRKPIKNEDRSQNWSTEGFSIGGRTMMDRSFEVLTAKKFSTGNRYSRIGCDDWVNTGNARSLVEQDKMEEYFGTGPMTFGSAIQKPSQFGTKWGTTFYCGTFFDKRDVGFRLFTKFQKEGKTTLKFDVYPKGIEYPETVLWPKARPPAYIERRRIELGRRVFNMRMRNLVLEKGTETFAQEDVDDATQEHFRFGELPDRARAIIGFDPAVGSIKKNAADPAIALYAEVPVLDDYGNVTDSWTAHFVKWESLVGYDFHKQCQAIFQWCDYYKLPVSIEKNTLQASYRQHMNRTYPSVKVYDHQTGAEKWDPENGVETFSPMFENHHAIIHAGGAPHDELQALKTQLVDWPQSQKKDIMMAFWFARSRLQRAKKIQESNRAFADGLPGYLGNYATYWGAR